MTDFRRVKNDDGEGATWLALVGKNQDGRDIAYSLMVFGWGTPEQHAAYQIHSKLDTPQFKGQENCDFFPHPCDCWSKHTEPYPNSSEADLWDVLATRSGVHA